MTYPSDPETTKRLDRNFAYKVPAGNQVQRIQTICQAARNFAELLQGTCPHSLEKALAFQNLELAVKWATDSITRNE
jgi:hypothetical protein